MKKILVSLFLMFSAMVSFASLPIKSEVINKMVLVNDYWISQNSDPGNNQWARSVYFTGNMDFYKLYPKDNYLKYAELWANKSSWALNGGTFTTNADNQTCGQVYIDLYNLNTVNTAYKISEIDQSIANMVNGTSSDAWWWIDALYMAMPVFTRLGVLNDEPAYFDRMYDFYYNTKYSRGLFVDAVGLWYRDESYKPPYSTKNGEKSFWARGNGWVIAAHARVLQLLPQDNSHRAEYIETLQKMAAALKERQRDDGFWNVSLDDPNEYPGPETSGTSFFTYAIAWGINNNILDSATYYPVVEKAWAGLTSIAVHDNGFLGYVQGVGAGPAYAPEYSTQDFGVGAFLLAGTEVAKLASGVMPIPNNMYIKSVNATDVDKVKIVFSGAVDKVSGLNTANYALSNNISILDASEGENDSIVMLAVSDMALGIYQLTVNNIKNTKDEPIENGEKKSFTYSGVYEVAASTYQWGTSNTPDKTLDFDFNTRWSADGSGQWILYDLGSLKKILSVDLAFYNGNQRQAYFSLEVSADGENYSQVFNGNSSGTTNGLQNYDFNDSIVRYVKIIGYGNSQSTWNSITETRIYWEKLNTKVTSIQSRALHIYPNPLKSGNNLNIQLKENSLVKNIEIYNLNGECAYSKEMNTTSTKIVLYNLNLKTGTYLIKLSTADSSHSTSLIIK